MYLERNNFENCVYGKRQFSKLYLWKETIFKIVSPERDNFENCVSGSTVYVPRRLLFLYLFVTSVGQCQDQGRWEPQPEHAGGWAIQEPAPHHGQHRAIQVLSLTPVLCNSCGTKLLCPLIQEPAPHTGQHRAIQVLSLTPALCNNCGTKLSGGWEIQEPAPRPRPTQSYSGIVTYSSTL